MNKCLKKLTIIFLTAMFLGAVLLGYKHRALIKSKIVTYCFNRKMERAYDGENTVSDLSYSGEVNAQKRYLAIGFDDFRRNDFDYVEPLFAEYDAEATFNRIAYDTTLSVADMARIDQIMNDGSELGDHTWFHCSYIYKDPLFNGQDEDSSEGNQEPFPSNDQLRNDYGNGENAFGFNLSENICDSVNIESWSGYNVAWKDLSDKQCQQIRVTFSIYKDTTGMLDKLDELSNRYCGTIGKSLGSWSDEESCYTGGIFTGCRTSSNHEIWERILEITQAFYQDQYSEDVQLITWSLPGSESSPFIFENDGLKYYDSDCTQLYNCLAQFPSSLYKDESGEDKYRSWTSLLREYGYKTTHDAWYPSRADGEGLVMMSKQFIYNASLSRLDALPYSTNRTISYIDIANEYPKEFFDDDSEKSLASQMYDAGGAFYEFIESLRQDTSNGMIHGEVIDSENTYSEKIFLKEILEYCKATGVEVVSKAEAYDICFNNVIDEGNLIYNATLRNTALEFMPDAENVPENPDGYTGDCKVNYDNDKTPILVVDGEATYLHYGIPIGELEYKAYFKGKGKISIYGIKNSSGIELETSSLDLLQEEIIDLVDFKSVDVMFAVPDNDIGEYEQVCEGLGDKYMGIKIVYSGELEICNIELYKEG